jgi:prophage regulatory protein
MNISCTNPVLLRREDVEVKTGLSRSSIYRLIELKSFPPAIDLTGSGRAVAWLESEINDWINTRIAHTRMSTGGAQ